MKVKLIVGSSDFDAVGKARTKASELGYAIGSMASDMPIALSKKTDYVAKWYNISVSEYERIDGVLLSLDFRGKKVWFVEFEEGDDKVNLLENWDNKLFPSIVKGI